MTVTPFDYNRIAIVGVGLLGASLAHAIAQRGPDVAVTLFDKAPEPVRAADIPGEVCETLEAAVAEADLVILCVPVGRLAELTEAASQLMKAGATLSDVGSVKGSAVEAMQAVCADHVHLVPGHPIAGTEKSGPDAGFAQLFEGAWHILTPLADERAAYQAAVTRLAEFWNVLGARVETMDAARHDRVLAITSHLPPLIAYNIVSTAYDMESVEEGEVVKYSAGGFRDFTRIAASDPVMWRDVFLANKDAVLETLGRFSEDLAALQRAIRWGDGEALMAEFTRARGIRRAIIDAGLETDQVDFGRRAQTQPDDDEKA